MTEARARAFAGAALLGIVSAGAGIAVIVVGPAALLIPLLAAGAAVMLVRPAVALSVFLVVTVLLEEDDESFFPGVYLFWEPLIGPSSPIDLLFLLLVVSVALDAGRRQLPLELPVPLLLPMLLLAAATIAGAITGYFNGGDHYGIALTIREVSYLLILPFLVLSILRDEQAVRAMAVAGLALAAYKGVEGTTGWLLGAGRPLGEGETMTYYTPASNWLLLVFVLTVVGGALTRMKVPYWMWIAAPFAITALAFSYRRSFWVAAILGLLVVLLLSTRRRRLVPVVAVLALSLWIAVTVGGGPEAESRVVQRAASLDPSEVQTSPGDRFRLAEQENVWREIVAHPITGLGIGVPWTVTSSLPDEKEGARNYVHVAVLWYWLKLGLAGVLAYVWLMIAGIWMAYGAWRGSATRDPLVATVALAVLAALLGYVVVETTATFTAVNIRMTILLAASFGWLAAARLRTAGTPDDPPAETAAEARA